MSIKILVKKIKHRNFQRKKIPSEFYVISSFFIKKKLKTKKMYKYKISEILLSSIKNVVLSR